MNILVTGSCGQLGRTLMDISSGYDHKCVFTDVAADGNVIALDVTDADAVREAVTGYGIDVIINCAGYTDVSRAEDDEAKAFLINSEAPAILAGAARENDAVLIHISTDYVFDGNANTPYPEDAPKGPLGVYARTKLDGEQAVTASGCRHIILRTSWMYSCYGKNFFKTIVEKTAGLPSISVVNDQTGTPTYAYDLASAIFLIIDDGKLDRTGVYNYSDEGVCSWYDFAKAINRGLGHMCDVRPCATSDFPSNVRRPAYSVLDKTRFKETFGYEVPHWQDSLDICIAEYHSKA